MIDERLKEIRDGKAPKIIARFDDEHRETKTMCVGVRWELFQKQDLLEISEVSFDFRCSVMYCLHVSPAVSWRRRIGHNLPITLRRLCWPYRWSSRPHRMEY